MQTHLGPYELGPEGKNRGIYEGDCRELGQAIPSESIDLIFTDPPYPKEFLYLYEWLVSFAERTLRPDGFLITYVAPYHKDTIMGYFRNHLEYFWDYIEYNVGNSPVIWPRYTVSRYKSLLCYRRFGSDSMPKPNVLGVFPVRGGDKRFHKWGQSQRIAEYYIERFTTGDMAVIDPLVGGGTTAAACLKLGRPYLAFDNDPECVKISRRRVEAVEKPSLFSYEQCELVSCEREA